MTNTIPAPEAKSDLSDVSPYDLLGTHKMRYAVQDAERIKQCLSAALASLPTVARAFRQDDAKSFSESFGAVELDLLRALAKAEALLEELGTT